MCTLSFVKKAALAGVLGTLLFAAPTMAHAQASLSGPFDTTTPIPSTPTDFSSSLSFPKFKKGLGTLLSAKVVIIGTLDSKVLVENAAGNPAASGLVIGTVEIGLTDPAGLLPGPAFDEYGGLTPGGFGDDILTEPVPYSRLVGGSQVQSKKAHKKVRIVKKFDIITDPDLLHEFEGAGSISLSLVTNTWTLNSSAGSASASLSESDLSVTGHITYEYAPTP